MLFVWWWLELDWSGWVWFVLFVEVGGFGWFATGAAAPKDNG